MFMGDKEMNLEERINRAEEAKNKYCEIIKKLPILEGSEKQILWANDIRKTYVELVNEFVAYKFDKKRLTPIIVNLVVINYMLENIKEARFYINNRVLLKCGYEAMAERFALNKIKRPSDFDSSIDYLVSLVRDGMDIDNIIKMLNEKIKEK